MITSCPQLSSVLVKTDRSINAGFKHHKTVFRQCLGKAKMYTPKLQMTAEELSIELVKMGLKPLSHYKLYA